MSTVFSTASAVTEGAYIYSIREGQTLVFESYLTGTDVINFYQKIGSTWYPMYRDGVQVQLTSTNNSVDIPGPRSVSIAKAGTSAVVTLELHNAGDLL